MIQLKILKNLKNKSNKFNRWKKKMIQKIFLQQNLKAHKLKINRKINRNNNLTK